MLAERGQTMDNLTSETKKALELTALLYYQSGWRKENIEEIRIERNLSFGEAEYMCHVLYELERGK